jgi:transcriptional regulator with XRE-family HTH domain
MTVGERIKIARESVKMSQDELAKRLGYKDRSSISKIEKAPDDNIAMVLVRKIADILNCSPMYLMGWDEQEKTATNDGNGMSEAKRQLLDLVENCSDEEVTRLLQMMELFLGKK